MNYSTTPCCPHCGNPDLRVDDMYDMSYDEDTVELSFVGLCLECAHSIYWTVNFFSPEITEIRDGGIEDY